MKSTFKYRLYPNQEQSVLFTKTFGCVRFIYNLMLRDKIDHYKETKEMLKNTPAQYKNQFPWLKEVDSLALVNAQLNLQKAYFNFFNHPEVGFPKFKSKKSNKFSYTTNNQKGTVSIVKNKYLKLPKVGLVRINLHRELVGEIRSATISKTPSGKYFISILVEKEDFEKLPESNQNVGIDLGIKDFATLSTGEKIPNPKHLSRSEKRLKMLQRNLSIKKKDSKRKEKARIKVAKQHEKIKNQRKDFLHKLSKRLIDENQIICLEDLKVKNMIKNHKLAKTISDVSWSEFISLLKYKAEWYGRTIVQIDQFYPSSQLCSVCGFKNEEVKDLNVRTWECPQCHAEHDRDLNASLNVLHEGLRTVGTTGIAQVI